MHSTRRLNAFCRQYNKFRFVELNNRHTAAWFFNQVAVPVSEELLPVTVEKVTGL